jgi:hypothetical protein
MSEPAAFYNTTLETKPELTRYRDIARTQEERIQWFFENAAEFLYTPSQILDYVFPGERVPLTSVRRAMTNLTARGVLLKTDRKRPGAFGRTEYCWRRLLPSRRQGELFEPSFELT